LMIDGITSAPFSAATLPPLEMVEPSDKEKIVRVSRERYGVRREVIEEKIAKWSGEMSEAAAKVPPMPEAGRRDPDQPKMHEITCSMCGKKTKVIFEPEPGRKVYCKPCLKKLQAGEGGAGNNFARRNGEGSGSAPKNVAPSFAPTPTPPAAAPAPRVSLADLARTEPVRFAGQRNDPERVRPKKEPQIEDLKQALRDALADAGQDPPAAPPE